MSRRNSSKSMSSNGAGLTRPSQVSSWPIGQNRTRVQWFPANQRLISLVRSCQGNYVLPPAVVRKANWRD